MTHIFASTEPPYGSENIHHQKWTLVYFIIWSSKVLISASKFLFHKLADSPTDLILIFFFSNHQKFGLRMFVKQISFSFWKNWPFLKVQPKIISSLHKGVSKIGRQFDAGELNYRSKKIPPNRGTCTLFFIARNITKKLPKIEFCTRTIIQNCVAPFWITIQYFPKYLFVGNNIFIHKAA